MSKFKFRVDEKLTIWQRTNFEVEASSKEEAIKYLKQHKAFNADELECQVVPSMDKYVEVIDTETPFDTMETLTVSDNQDQPTLVFYDENNELICDNGEGNVEE